MSEWKTKRLGDISTINYGYTAKASFNKADSLFLRITDIQDNFVDWKTVPYCSISEIDYEKYKLIDNDIVFARTGATTGKSYLIKKPPKSVAASYLIRLRLTDCDILPEFIAKYFQTPTYWNDISLGIVGSAQGGFNASKLSDLIIPVPPIEEQKRIVEILDKAFEGIAQAEANTRQSLINIRNFFKRYLDKSIHKNNSNWDRVKFQDILSQQPRNGWSPPAENHSDIGVPVLTLSSVTGFHFNIQKIKFTNAPVKVGAHYWLNNGEFLMTRSNTSELVGHVAICENITEPTICCDLIMKMSINPQWAETKFIYWYFRTSKLRHLISNSAQGANPTMKKINKAIVQNFPVFIPPIVEQKKIVEQIEECYQKTQKLETIYQRKLEAIAELKQSILEKAFTGQLSQ
ncbi:MAG: restriction endonuclease subunit S [Microcystis sp. M049S2]|uniref:restriction endonuclease subunit S n=1 Tax=Microcystis sp. M049S2 TaxID=2771169 RepID=UPI002585282B|nr:restriction endonuclease subunit S [Microcystis sp. M049S2]MCA2657414.1 restriction endonuclease subunit S [Microcystis sp. M049S2]